MRPLSKIINTDTALRNIRTVIITQYESNVTIKYGTLTPEYMVLISVTDEMHDEKL